MASFFLLLFLRTMHKTALFTIIYCNSLFFTDNGVVTVRLPGDCCDMYTQVRVVDEKEDADKVISQMETC